MVHLYRDTLDFHTVWAGGNFAEFETASALFADVDAEYARLSKSSVNFRRRTYDFLFSASATFMLHPEETFLKSAAPVKHRLEVC